MKEREKLPFLENEILTAAFCCFFSTIWRGKTQMWKRRTFNDQRDGNRERTALILIDSSIKQKKRSGGGILQRNIYGRGGGEGKTQKCHFLVVVLVFDSIFVAFFNVQLFLLLQIVLLVCPFMLLLLLFLPVWS